MSLLRKAAIGVVSGFSCMVHATDERASTEVRAQASIKGKEISGTFEFKQEKYTSNTLITGVVNGLYPDRQHGVQVHEVTPQGLGPTFNPFGKQHGGPWNAERKVGDLGNILVDSQGVGHFSLDDPFVKLSGPFSVVGKSIAVHENPDDLGFGRKENSKIDGGVGAPIAHGVITKQ